MMLQYFMAILFWKRCRFTYNFGPNENEILIKTIYPISWLPFMPFIFRFYRWWKHPTGVLPTIKVPVRRIKHGHIFIWCDVSWQLYSIYNRTLCRVRNHYFLRASDFSRIHLSHHKLSQTYYMNARVEQRWNCCIKYAMSNFSMALPNHRRRAHL